MRIEALRCRVMLLLERGYPTANETSTAGCVQTTVYRTLYRFELLGEEVLHDQRTQRPGDKVTSALEQQLLRFLGGIPLDYGWQRCGWTLELLALKLNRDTETKLSCSTVYRLLHRRGCRRNCPRACLRTAVRERREVLERIAKRVASTSSEEEAFCQDETDLQLNPKIGATNLMRGQQPVVLTPEQNVKRNIFGALNARAGRIISRITERKNAALFVEYLKYLSATYRRTQYLHLVLSNFIIHQARIVMSYLKELNGRIVLHFLLPYSSDDNIIEQLWKQIHHHVTRIHRHRTIDTLLVDVRRFWTSAQPIPGTQVSNLSAA